MIIVGEETLQLLQVHNIIRFVQVREIHRNASNLFFYNQFSYGIKYMRKLAPIIPATINVVINIPFFVIFLLPRL